MKRKRKDLKPGAIFRYAASEDKDLWWVPVPGQEKPIGMWASAPAQCDLEREVEVISELDDLVNTPAHYTRLTPEPIDVIMAWELEFPEGSAVKYIARAGHKPGADRITDLKKAVTLLNFRIKKLESA